MNIDQRNPNDFYVEKFEKRIVMMTDTGKPRRVDCSVMLNFTSRSGSGRENLKEFLENMGNFIPVRMGSSERFSIINSDTVIYVHEKEEVDVHEVARYSILLAGRIKINVGQYIKLPEAKGRFLDTLLQNEKFATFLLRGARIHINKTKILSGVDNE